MSPTNHVTVITNREGLKALTTLVRAGRSTRNNHNCAARGTINVTFTNGQTLNVGFGPGHDALTYEFGMDGHLYKTSREAFVRALETAGVATNLIPLD